MSSQNDRIVSDVVVETKARIEEIFSLLVFTKGGAVAQWVERWTCDQQVVGSNPTQGKAA